MAKVTGISPKSAKYTGGEQVVVSGSGFTGATRVFFEDVNSKAYDAQFTVDSDSRITVTTPAMERDRKTHLFVIVGGQESNVAQVRVEDPDGQGIINSSGQIAHASTMGAGNAHEFHFTQHTAAEANAQLNQMLSGGLQG
ncbi:IPT/TIG domain-containing protein [Nocardia sp. NPDC057227]|uniref:IPT/TIG domain-containing protein n=1 Tax=Nocardia sp. NPDC057227 TaxID=3346056 RepID=UPI003626448D